MSRNTTYHNTILQATVVCTGPAKGKKISEEKSKVYENRKLHSLAKICRINSMVKSQTSSWFGSRM